METLREVAAELHDCLNIKIWDEDNNLRPLVRDKLLSITKQYAQDSEVLNYEDILDAEIVGSNASYNYTPQSDLDLHLVVNMESLSCDPALFQLACNAEKINFNKSYDIKVKGIDVELYVEDVKSCTASNGIYSLFKDEWIKFPAKIEVPSLENDSTYNTLLNEYKTKAEALLEPNTSAEDINNYINSLYTLRRSGIMNDGEFSKGNFIFKEIRNLGLLDALKDALKDIRSKELSVESLLVNNESINYNNSSESRKFIELPSFTYALSQLKLGDDFLQELQNRILKDPDIGDIIPGSGGARKIRFKLRNKGSQGGVRIVYIDIVCKESIYLLDMYSKNTKKDLTPAEKASIFDIIKEGIPDE